MSLIAEMLDRLSGVSALRDRVAETGRHVDQALNWLLDHEKRLVRLEAGGRAPPPPKRRRLPSGG